MFKILVLVFCIFFFVENIKGVYVSDLIPQTSTVSGLAGLASVDNKKSLLINFWDQELTSFKSRKGQLITEPIATGREVSATGLDVYTDPVSGHRLVALAREFDGLVELLELDDDDNVLAQNTLNSGAPVPCFFCLFTGQPLNCGFCEFPTIPGLFGINDVNFNAAGELYGGSVFQDGRVWKISLNPAVFPTTVSLNPSPFNETRIRGVAFCGYSNNLLFGITNDPATIVKIDVTTGFTQTLATIPGSDTFLNSLECDCDGYLYTINRRTGTIFQVNSYSGVISNSFSSIPLASHIAITRNCWNGNCKPGSKTKLLIGTALVEVEELKVNKNTKKEVINNFAAGLGSVSYAKEGGKDYLYLANIRSVLKIDLSKCFGDYGFLVSNQRLTGTTGYGGTRPSGNTGAISVSGNNILISDYTESTRLEVVDRLSFTVQRTYGGFLNPLQGVLGSVELISGFIIVCQFTENPSFDNNYVGNLLSLAPSPDPTNPFIPDFRITKVLTNIPSPTGIVKKDETTVYIAITNYPSRNSGEVWEVDLTTSTYTVLDVLVFDLPEGLGLLSDGRIVVVNAGDKSLETCDPSDGSVFVVDDNLPINKPGLRSAATGPWLGDIGNFFNGVAVDDHDNVYLPSDVQNSVFKYSGI